MNWKFLTPKRLIVTVVALMLILISASGCIPNPTEKAEDSLSESNTPESPAAEMGSAVPDKTGEAPVGTETPTASETEVVWTPFV